MSDKNVLNDILEEMAKNLLKKAIEDAIERAEAEATEKERLGQGEEAKKLRAAIKQLKQIAATHGINCKQP